MTPKTLEPGTAWDEAGNRASPIHVGVAIIPALGEPAGQVSLELDCGLPSFARLLIKEDDNDLGGVCG